MAETTSALSLRGWVVVPLEASAEMTEAGSKAEIDTWNGKGSTFADDPRPIYRAMLAASPLAFPGASAWRCPDCRCHTFAEVAERKPDGSYGPGGMIRCVNCKGTFPTPAPTTLTEAVTAARAEGVREGLERAGSPHSKDFQLMLVRIIQRHRNGRDLTDTLKGAEDLLRRKGSLSVFRAPTPPTTPGGRTDG